MEHIAALLLIIGCSDDLATCKELPAPVPVFETSQECEVELARAFTPYIDEYPQVFAQCVAVDPALEDEDAELVWDVRSDGTLFAEVGDPDVMVAQGRLPSGRGDRLTGRN
ncbi:MAG: hypothetical protein K5872_22720 [Rhizobiaceae bacterium]|nr:hypothetical protein [Rhizobiaceae bacterium]MCV0409036.1 hypothetical protein [Rhizobiaceae bacterium]